ncbi:MAG: hypothetical protein K2P76_13250 [Lachnospiraceae bacterium]|nr:hypothetical protein [Lachnospiraceae bacterium]
MQFSNILDGSVIQDYIWFLAGLFWCFCVFYLPGKYVFSQSITLGMLLIYCMVRLMRYLNINMLGFQNCNTYLIAFALGYVFNILYEKKDGMLRRIISNIKLQMIYIFVYFYLMIKNYRLPVELRFSGAVTSCSGIIMVIFASVLIKKLINVKRYGELLKTLSYYTFPVYLIHIPLWYFLEVIIVPVIHPERFVIIYWIFEIGFVIIVPICLSAFYLKMKNTILNTKPY